MKKVERENERMIVVDELVRFEARESRCLTTELSGEGRGRRAAEKVNERHCRVRTRHGLTTSNNLVRLLQTMLVD